MLILTGVQVKVSSLNNDGVYVLNTGCSIYFCNPTQEEKKKQEGVNFFFFYLFISSLRLKYSKLSKILSEKSTENRQNFVNKVDIPRLLIDQCMAFTHLHLTTCLLWHV